VERLVRYHPVNNNDTVSIVRRALLILIGKFHRFSE
jgi:hypothetical protein